MKYTYTIDGFSRKNNAKPDIRFTCADCGHQSTALTGFFWRASLSADQKTETEAACLEFVTLLNASRFEDLFFKRTTAKACASACCHCPDNVSDIETERCYRQARGMLLRYLERKS